MAEIEGIEQLIKNLERIGKDVDKALFDGMDKASRRVKRDAKALCSGFKDPTGQLQGSIDNKTERSGENIEAVVFSNSDHAAYVEFGTGQRGAGSDIERPDDISYRSDWAGMRAHPYMYPALKQNKDKAEKDVADALKKIL